MSSGRRGYARALLFGACLAVAFDAGAHSASDAYLSLEVQPGATAGPNRNAVISAQWDIALRDLDFALGLDDDGDGKISWRELRAHQKAIERYAMAKLSFSADNKPCKVAVTKQMVDNHADGAYSALFLDIACTGSPRALTLNYQLFFAIDPSHRAIVVSRSGNDVATAVLSPQNAKINLSLESAGRLPSPAR